MASPGHQADSQHLLGIIDSIPSLIHTGQPDGYLDYFNRQWLQYVGLPLEDILGWKWTAAIHPEDVDAILAKWRDSLATGKPFLHEARVRRADGEYRWMLHQKVAARDEAGHIVKWYGSSIDIEERKRTEFFLAEGQRLSHMGSWAFHEDGFDYWSPALFQIFGLAGGKAPNLQEYLALVHPEDREFVSQTIQKMFAENHGCDFIKRIVRPDGGIRHVRCVGIPAPTHGKDFRGFIGTGIDVTEQERLTDALCHSQYYLAEGERVGHTGSWAWNVADRSAVHLSDEWYRIYGFDPAEGPPDWEKRLERIHPEDRPKWKDTLEWAMREKADYEVDFRVLLPDGTIKWIHTFGHPVLTSAGDLLQFLGSSTDITERKQGEQKLQEQEMELRQILDLAPQSVAVFGRGGERLYANRVALDSLGLSLEEWRQTPGGTFGASWFIHPDDRERVARSYSDSIGGGSVFEVEIRVRMADGSFRWHLARFNPLNDDKGQVTRWYVASTDIEERKRTEERLQQENVALREEIDKASMFEEIVGTSPALKIVLSNISKVAPSDSTVLITGETGTGKELVARAIHRRSNRASRPFVSVNCAVIPRDLIASELFGHEKGAFTGASQQRLGRFELANGGTIFLDEVGELPLETQIALLRVLQEHEFERVGGTRQIRADVRVIAATNRDLQAAIGSGSFRSDLFYRLHVFPIEIPSLRERAEDIPLLVEYFIDRYARKAGKNIRGVSKKTLKLLQSYSWPGNIRELQNVVERSVILCEAEIFSIDESWLPRQLLSTEPRNHAQFPQKLLAQEKNLIEDALKESRGRVFGPNGAAAKLGIPRSTLESKIRSLKIDKNRFKASLE